MPDRGRVRQRALRLRTAAAGGSRADRRRRRVPPLPPPGGPRHRPVLQARCLCASGCRPGHLRSEPGPRPRRGRAGLHRRRPDARRRRGHRGPPAQQQPGQGRPADRPRYRRHRTGPHRRALVPGQPPLPGGETRPHRPTRSTCRAGVGPGRGRCIAPAAVPTPDDVLGRIDAIIPRLRERAEETERLRRLPESTMGSCRTPGSSTCCPQRPSGDLAWASRPTPRSFGGLPGAAPPRPGPLGTWSSTSGCWRGGRSRSRTKSSRTVPRRWRLPPAPGGRGRESPGRLRDIGRLELRLRRDALRVGAAGSAARRHALAVPGPDVRARAAGRVAHRGPAGHGQQ